MKHYVLVHGGCHGAWCWYKVKPVLEASGHRVTVVDLTASGVNMSKVEEIQTLEDYAKPLASEGYQFLSRLVQRIRLSSLHIASEGYQLVLQPTCFLVRSLLLSS